MEKSYLEMDIEENKLFLCMGIHCGTIKWHYPFTSLSTSNRVGSHHPRSRHVRYLFVGCAFLYFLT